MDPKELSLFFLMDPIKSLQAPPVGFRVHTSSTAVCSALCTSVSGPSTKKPKSEGPQLLL